MENDDDALDAATAESDDARLGLAARVRAPPPRRGRRRERARARARRRRRARGVRDHAQTADPRRAATALAPGAAGGAARRLLLARAHRARGDRDQLPRDLQRSHRRAHHGVRPRVRARVPALPPAAAQAGVAPGTPGRRRDPPARGDGADRRRRRDRWRGGAAGRLLRHARHGDRRAASRGAAGRPEARRARRARLAPAAGRFRHPHGPAHAGDRGLHASRALSAHEAHRLLHQHRARHDDTARRPGRRAAGRRDRRRGPRRLRAGAAPGRPPAVDDARRPHHAPHRWPRPASGRAALRDPAGQLAPLSLRPAAPQRRGQGQLVLSDAAGRGAAIVGKWKGARYGIPIEHGNFQQMYINVDLWKKAGLDPDKPVKALDDWLAAMKKLTVLDAKGETTQAGFALRHKGHPVGITDKFLPFAHAYGARMLSPNLEQAAGFANSAEMVAALQFYTDLVQKHKVASLAFPTPEDAFGQKRAATIFRESWYFGWVKKNAPDVTFKVVALPCGKACLGAGNLFPWTNLVYKNSPNEQAAWEFLRFISTAKDDLDQHQAQGILPVWTANLESAYVKARPDYQSTQDMLKQPVPPEYYHPKSNELATAFGEAVVAALYGS